MILEQVAEKYTWSQDRGNDGKQKLYTIGNIVNGAVHHHPYPANVENMVS